MKATNLVQRARSIKYDSVLAYLRLAFQDFAYPVYLFGSYATGRFHGHSDVDILVIAPDAQSVKAYSQVSDKMAGLGMNYDILISPSIERLDNSIVSTLQVIHTPQEQRPASPPDCRHQTGMTLIEIMISLLIGVFLLAGVITIFLNSKQTYRMQEGISRLQENGRFAMEFISKDVRMAGFRGCNSQAPITNTLNGPTDFLYDFATGIQGFEATSTTAWTPTLTTAIAAEIPSALGGSDIITIRRADDQSVTVTTHANGSAVLTLDTSATITNLKSAGFLTSATTPANNCTIAVASNCSQAAVFQVSGIDTTARTLSHSVGGACAAPKNLSADLVSSFAKGQVYPINTITYYVRNNTAVPPQPSLYRRIGLNAAEELVEGIEKLEIFYGVDRIPLAATVGDQSPDYYVTANNVIAAATGTLKAADWSNVVSVRIQITVSTIDSNLTTTGGKISRTINSTIAVRNRLQ
jgi:type IV pilus assembly protein PilW